MQNDEAWLLALLIFLFSVAVMSAAAIYYGARLSAERIPMQWGKDGAPTWYASRSIGLWWQVGFTILVATGLFIFAAISSREKVADISLTICLLSIITALTQVWHLRAVCRWDRRQ